MNRPRRLAPRYPARLAALVQTVDGARIPYPARDVSSGGIFLATDAPLEIFSEPVVGFIFPLDDAHGRLAGAVQVLQLESFIDEDARVARDFIVALTLAMRDSSPGTRSSSERWGRRGP